jgi:hypothetical protein
VNLRRGLLITHDRQYQPTQRERTPADAGPDLVPSARSSRLLRTCLSGFLRYKILGRDLGLNAN